MENMETDSKITFTNEPKLSPHEVDSKFNERRLNLIPHVKNFINNYELFKDKNINVTFSHKGVSSLVSIIEASEKKFVLKVALSIAHNLGEGLFLKVWEDNGVKVPHVFEHGFMGEHAYTLMEFVDAPTLETMPKEERVEKGIDFEMGKILRTMHKPEAEGYGRLLSEKPEYSTFTEWILSDDMKERYDYVKEQSLLTNEHGSLDNAIKILTNYSSETKSSYCHEDFGSHNLFSTSPITVFDPSPRFNNRYWDLGRSVYKYIVDGISPEQFLAGYFENEQCDENVLRASILINSYYKFPYAHKTDKVKTIQNVQTYLLNNKL